MKRKSFITTSLCFGFFLPFMGDSLVPIKSLVTGQAKPLIRIDTDSWQSMVQAVQRRAAGFQGTVGFVIQDLQTGETVAYKADSPFLSASLIKVPIMVAVYKAVEDGLLSLDTEITLRRDAKRGGSGVLKRAKVGTRFTNRQLVEVMIIHSDNTATELLVQQLGYEFLRKTFRELGLINTEIHPDGFKLKPRYVADDNMTSPRDMANLLEGIYKGNLISQTASGEMLQILMRQKLRDRLPKLLPDEVIVAHKTGLLRRSCHDVGIVFGSKGDYLICVLTSNDKTYRLAKQFIASINRITYDFYEGGRLHTAAPATEHTAG